MSGWMKRDGVHCHKGDRAAVDALWPLNLLIFQAFQLCVNLRASYAPPQHSNSNLYHYRHGFAAEIWF